MSPVLAALYASSWHGQGIVDCVVYDGAAVVELMLFGTQVVYL